MRRPRFVRFRWLFDGVWRRFLIFLWFCLVLGEFSIGKRALVDDLGPVCGGQVLPTRPFSVSPEKKRVAVFAGASASRARGSGAASEHAQTLGSYGNEWKWPSSRGKRMKKHEKTLFFVFHGQCSGCFGGISGRLAKDWPPAPAWSCTASIIHYSMQGAALAPDNDPFPSISHVVLRVQSSRWPWQSRRRNLELASKAIAVEPILSPYRRHEAFGVSQSYRVDQLAESLHTAGAEGRSKRTARSSRASCRSSRFAWKPKRRPWRMRPRS